MFDSRPPTDQLAQWFMALPDSHQRFFAERGELAIPFAWYGGYPAPFAAAALANDEVQENIRDFPAAWREDSIRRAPPMRWEFEFVLAFGGMEVCGWAKNKSGWGKLLWIAPLQPGDPVHPQYLECIHKPESKFRQGLEQRRWMKRRLGRRHRSLVGKARTYTKRDFISSVAEAEERYRAAVAKSLENGRPAVILFPPDSAAVMRRRLAMDPGTFWQHARGKPLPAERMAEPKQLTLFEG